jgi:hypothetical protein
MGRPTPNIENLSEEYQLEVEDLKELNEQGLKIVFNSIVQTLFDEEIPIDKQCLVRKKGFFKSWLNGFIKYDDKYIYFNVENKTSRYKFKNIDLKYSSKSKRSFEFLYRGEEVMTVKFEKP